MPVTVVLRFFLVQSPESDVKTEKVSSRMPAPSGEASVNDPELAKRVDQPSFS